MVGVRRQAVGRWVKAHRAGGGQDLAAQRGGHTNVTHIDMPVSPSRVWAAING